MRADYRSRIMSRNIIKTGYLSLYELLSAGEVLLIRLEFGWCFWFDHPVLLVRSSTSELFGQYP